MTTEFYQNSAHNKKRREESIKFHLIRIPTFTNTSKILNSIDFETFQTILSEFCLLSLKPSYYKNTKNSEFEFNTAPPSRTGGNNTRCISCKRVALYIKLMQAPHWRSRQQLDWSKIPSDDIPIGSGTLAGDLGGIILRKQQKWHYILLFQYCFWQASMAACLADMDQWNYCEQIALTYLLKLVLN